MIGKLFAFIGGFFAGTIFGGIVVKMIMDKLLQGGLA